MSRPKQTDGTMAILCLHENRPLVTAFGANWRWSDITDQLYASLGSLRPFVGKYR